MKGSFELWVVSDEQARLKVRIDLSVRGLGVNADVA